MSACGKQDTKVEGQRNLPQPPSLASTVSVGIVVALVATYTELLWWFLGLGVLGLGVGGGDEGEKHDEEAVSVHCG